MAIDLNTATTEQLKQVPNIDENMAGNIVDYRESNGEFLAWEDVRDVSGMTEDGLRSLRQHATIGAKAEEDIEVEGEV